MKLAINDARVKRYNLRNKLLIPMEELSPNEKSSDIAHSDEFPTRLKQAIGDKSIRGFARECGFSDTVLRQYLNGQSEPTRPALLAIARTARVSVEWLAVGKTASSTEEITEGYVYKEPLAFEVNWLKAQFPKCHGHLLLTQVPDESMEPTLGAGALILVDTSDRDLTTIKHGIYLLKLEDRILVKRLQYIAGGTLRVLSDNKVYETFSIMVSAKSSEVSIMGKAVWFSYKL